MSESPEKGNNGLSKAEKVRESNNCQGPTQFPMFLSQMAKILSSSCEGRNWEPDNDGNWISLQWVETQRRHNLIYQKQKQMCCLFYELPCQFALHSLRLALHSAWSTAPVLLSGCKWANVLPGWNWKEWCPGDLWGDFKALHQVLDLCFPQEAG